MKGKGLSELQRHIECLQLQFYNFSHRSRVNRETQILKNHFSSHGHIFLNLFELKFFKRKTIKKRITNLILCHLSPNREQIYIIHLQRSSKVRSLNQIFNCYCYQWKIKYISETNKNKTKSVEEKKLRKHRINTKFYCHLGFTLGAKKISRISSMKCISLAPTLPDNRTELLSRTSKILKNIFFLKDEIRALIH